MRNDFAATPPRQYSVERDSRALCFAVQRPAAGARSESCCPVSCDRPDFGQTTQPGSHHNQIGAEQNPAVFGTLELNEISAQLVYTLQHTTECDASSRLDVPPDSVTQELTAVAGDAAAYCAADLYSLHSSCSTGDSRR